MGNSGCFPLRKPAATESRYPTCGACLMFWCFHNPPKSDMNYRIFNVRTDVNACDCTRGCTDTVRESALIWNVTICAPLAWISLLLNAFLEGSLFESRTLHAHYPLGKLSSSGYHYPLCRQRPASRSCPGGYSGCTEPLHRTEYPGSPGTPCQPENSMVVVV